MIRLYLPALCLGCVLDILIGDPAWLYHPVRLIGHWIHDAEHFVRKHVRPLRFGAVLLTLSTCLITALTTWGVLVLLSLLGTPFLFLGMVLLDWMGLAARSLSTEALLVGKALEKGLEDGRRQVARIVGRDTAHLNEEEVVKATVETVSENTTDAVIAPMLYAFIGGSILLWIFKAVSTLDSMVGYLDDRYRDVGWSSAKMDDLLNWVPARLTAFLMCVAAFFCRLDAKHAFKIVHRDHGNHLSPNCAWSEAAAAGALHIQLGGTHDYFGKPVVKPTIGDPDRSAQRSDIRFACRLMWVSGFLFLLLLCTLYLLLWR